MHLQINQLLNRLFTCFSRFISNPSYVYSFAVFLCSKYYFFLLMIFDLFKKRFLARQVSIEGKMKNVNLDQPIGRSN